jgi:hypothetical protein
VKVVIATDPGEAIYQFNEKTATPASPQQII